MDGKPLENKSWENNNHWENGKNALDMEKRMDRMETKTSYVLKSMAFPNQCTLW